MNVRTRGADATSSSTALENKRILLAKPGILFDLLIFNSGAGAYYAHLYNKATTPTNGDVPVAVISVSAGNQNGFAYAGGRPFSVGIACAISTSLDTLTLGSAEAWFDGGFTVTSGS